MAPTWSQAAELRRARSVATWQMIASAAVASALSTMIAVTAGKFITEAPYWSASAFQSDPNAGAGRFTTEAPPWASSAFTSNPEAGAGPFETERNTPVHF